MATKATERFEMRLRAEVIRHLREAAELEQVPLSQFLLEAGLSKADEVLADRRSWTVSSVVFDELVSALDAPPKVIEELARAARASSGLIERR